MIRPGVLFLPGRRGKTLRAFTALPVALALLSAASTVPITVYQAPLVGAHTVVTGVVTAGGAPAGGASVTVVVWPNPSVLDAMAEDEMVDTIVAAVETTDARGRFTASVDPSTLAPTHLGPGGQIDIELVIEEGGRQLIWNFSTAPAASLGTPTVGASMWGNPRVDDASLVGRADEQFGPTHLAIDIGTETATVVELGNEPAHWVGDDGLPLGQSDAALAAATVPVGQSWSSIESDSASTAAVPTGWRATSTYRRDLVERFINSIGTIQGKPSVIQEIGTQHTLGVAVQDTLKSSSYSQSGTITKSFSAAAENVMTYTGSVRNRVNYRLWQFICAGRICAREWRAHSHYDLNTDSVVISRPKWTNCGSVKKNGTFTKSQGTNVTFSTGVGLGIISLSSQARFSSDTKIRWTFSGSGAKMCGSNSGGPASAPQAGAFVP